MGIFFNASTSTQCMIRPFDAVFSVYDSVVSALFRKAFTSNGALYGCCFYKILEKLYKQICFFGIKK